MFYSLTIILLKNCCSKRSRIKADQNEFQLQPHFEQEIVNLGDDKYDVHLSFDITPTEDHPMPFHICCYCGTFHLF